MAQQEVLELVATAIDRATPALEQVRNEIDRLRGSNVQLDNDTRRALTNSTRHINALVGTQPGLRQAAQNMTTVSTAARTMTTSVGGATSVIQREFVPLITRATSAIVGATLSILAFNRAIERTREVSNLSTMTGFGRDTIRGFQELGRNLGISGDAINRQIENFSRQAQQIKRLGMGQFGESLAKLPWGDPQRLKADLEEARTLRNKGLITEQQFLDRVVKARTEHIKRMQAQIGPQETATVLQELFGDDPEVLHRLIMSMPLPELERRMRALAAATRELDPDQVKKYTEAQANLNRELHNFTVDVLNPLLPKITDLINLTADMMKAPPGKYWLIDKLTEAATALMPIWADIKSGFETLAADLQRIVWPHVKIEIDLAIGDLKRFVAEEWPRIAADVRKIYNQLKGNLEGEPIDWSVIMGTNMMGAIDARMEVFFAIWKRRWIQLKNAFGFESNELLEQARREEAAALGRAAKLLGPGVVPLEQRSQQAYSSIPGAGLPSISMEDIKARLGIPTIGGPNEGLVPQIPPMAVPPRGGARPQRFTGGGESEPNFLFTAPPGGGIFAHAPESTNIEDRRSEEANTRELVKLTEEMKKLNENFMRGVVGTSFAPGTGGAALGGPGVGGGPGAGAGVQGSTAPMGRLPDYGGTGTPSTGPGAPPPEDRFTPGPGNFGPPPGQFTPSPTPRNSEIMGDREGKAKAAADNMRRYIAGIGFLETSFDPKVANKSEAGNTGFYKFNAADARKAAKAGLPDPRAGSLAQQTEATRRYIEKFYPKQAEMIKAGNFAGANATLSKFWVSLPGGSQQQHPKRYQEYARILGGTSTHSGAQMVAGGPQVPPATQAVAFTGPQQRGVSMAPVRPGEPGALPEGTFSPGLTQLPKFGDTSSLAATAPRAYAQRQGERGEFNAARTGEFGPPGKNMTQIELNNGQRLTVNKAVAGRYQGFLNEMLDRGYPVDVRGGGGFAMRSKRGGGGPSMHAFGTAVDINVGANPMRKGGTTNMPEAVETTAWKHGLSWGGRFGDPMHFEAMGASAWKSKMAQLERRGLIGPSAPVTMLATRPGDTSVAGPGAPEGVSSSFFDPRRFREIGAENLQKMERLGDPAFFKQQDEYRPPERLGSGFSGAGLEPGSLEPGSLAAKSEPVQVNGTGTIDVNVKAPRGTSVRAEGGGMFNQINMNRKVAEEPASQGPPAPASPDEE